MKSSKLVKLAYAIEAPFSYPSFPDPEVSYDIFALMIPTLFMLFLLPIVPFLRFSLSNSNCPTQILIYIVLSLRT